uniref:Uncharacterized protein n=1 Tax=Acrobeloides nanus TaxID=290746 RepID=A0A914EPB9_9BILA
IDVLTKVVAMDLFVVIVVGIQDVARMAGFARLDLKFIA